ncbi:immunity protein YezG family protein [Streptococcus salivarius]|nr:immunity protein YezG family protein [Streptococcus salivarius]MBZ5835699.1 antitoxin YezG family protein [Streptococcus salivarius]
MKQFEDKFMEVQVSMISLALEYVRAQAEKIFIYAIADSLYSFNVFYKINGHVVRKHKVNKYLPKESNIDTGLQSSLLKEGIKDVEAMLAICKEYNREHPTEMWLVYDAETNILFDKSEGLKRVFIDNDLSDWYICIIHLDENNKLSVDFDYAPWLESDFGPTDRINFFRYKFLGFESRNEKELEQFKAMEAFQQEHNRK